MKRKRISFLAMLILAVILLMPASIQAATKPGAVKLTKITAVDYNKISIKWKESIWDNKLYCVLQRSWKQ